MGTTTIYDPNPYFLQIKFGPNGGQASQAAEKRPCFVILSEAKNLSSI
jgi:hypothetical protein